MTTIITFAGRIPGMNDKDGLLRLPWYKRKNVASKYQLEVMMQTRAQHKGQVTFKLERYSMSAKTMDYDNLVSTSKLPVDSLVKCKIILDDNPDVITDRKFIQIRVKTAKEQKTVITITDVE